MNFFFVVIFPLPKSQNGQAVIWAPTTVVALERPHDFGHYLYRPNPDCGSRALGSWYP